MLAALAPREKGGLVFASVFFFSSPSLGDA